MTKEDILAALSVPENPIGQVRNVVGDTAQTIVASQENNAAWHALCDKK